jgi:hypothetical protein
MQVNSPESRIASDIAASRPAIGPERLTADYVRPSPFDLSPDDRNRCAAYKDRALDRMMNALKAACAEPKPEREEPEPFCEFTGPMGGGR